MVGFQPGKRTRKVEAAIAAGFRALAAVNVSDFRSRMTAGRPALRPIHKSGVEADPASIIRTRPDNNPMARRATDIAEPDDVIVVDGGGDLTNSPIGELMWAHAQIGSIAGLVVEPGDLIVGDGDGIASVPYDLAEAVLTTMEPKRQSEIKALAAIRQDQSDRAWVDAALTRLSCRINT